MEINVSDVLNYLDEIGWSSIIDSRWKKEVISDIRSKFPNISTSMLQEILKIVLY